MHPAILPINTLLKECTIRHSRRGGPGGQHRNKVETAVIVTHESSTLQAEANERRSQAQNRSVAIFRLRLILALEIRTPPAPSPSPLWQARLDGKRLAINAAHDHFPALLAEALDHLTAKEYDMRIAAERLCVSTSQLIKLLAKEPRALEMVNRQREQRGLGRLQG